MFTPPPPRGSSLFGITATVTVAPARGCSLSSWTTPLKRALTALLASACGAVFTAASADGAAEGEDACAAGAADAAPVAAEGADGPARVRPRIAARAASGRPARADFGGRNMSGLLRVSGTGGLFCTSRAGCSGFSGIARQTGPVPGRPPPLLLLHRYTDGGTGKRLQGAVRSGG